VITRTAEALPHDDVLVNLDRDQPAAFARFHRLVEIVGRDDDDKQAARDRYRFYRDRGYEIHTHKLGGDG
jgi:DNA polymerase-3 subunit chi